MMQLSSESHTSSIERHGASIRDKTSTAEQEQDADRLVEEKAAELAQYAAQQGIGFDVEQYLRNNKGPQEINSPILHEDGTFSISKERFPDLSFSAKIAFDNYDWPDT